MKKDKEKKVSKPIIELKELTLKELLKELKDVTKKFASVKTDKTRAKHALTIQALESEIAIKGDTPLEKAIVSEVADDFYPTFLHGGEKLNTYQFGIIENNRPIEDERVTEFLKLIEDGDYDDDYPIIAMKASDLDNSDENFNFTDFKYKKISKAALKHYLIIIDGQHRTKAWMKLCAIDRDKYCIPNVRFKEVKNEKNFVSKYLVSINKTGKMWDIGDKQTVAQLTLGKEPFNSIVELMKKGFSASTASIICTGKTISNSKMNKILEGVPYDFGETLEVTIKQGEKFVTTCEKKGIDFKFIKKRYLINGFNQFTQSHGGDFDLALQVLDNVEYTESKFKEIRFDSDFLKLMGTTYKDMQKQNN